MKRSLIVVVLVVVSIALVGCNLISIPAASQRDLAVSGLVLDENGAGVGGVLIKINPGGQTTTNVEGGWSFDQARKGSKVTAEKAGFEFSEAVTVTKADQIINFLALVAIGEEPTP